MDNNQKISADSTTVVEVLLNQMKELQRTNAILQVNVLEKDNEIKKLKQQLNSKKSSHK